MKAWVLGATGATGRQIVDKLLCDEGYTEVHVFVRRQPELKHPKLRVHLMNFERDEDWQIVQEGDVAFSCMGTTIRDAGSREAQYRVDVEYQLRFAEMAKRCGVKSFVLQSSAGADASSRYFYLRIKGEVEEGVKSLGFERTLVVRPGVIDRGTQARFWERVWMLLIKSLNTLGLARRYAVITTETLAGQMIKASQLSGSGVQVYSLEEIFKL